MANDRRIDEAKGRAKQAAGDLTDDQDLKDEGRVEQATADAKEKVDSAASEVKDKAEGFADRVKSFFRSSDDR